jgi:hypothetical protein
LLFGGAALTLTALLIVVPLKGGAVAWAAFPERFIGGFLVNGAWGLGAVIFARTFRLAAVFSRG